MRHAPLLALAAALAVLHSGCSCIIDTEADEGPPCLKGLCAPGYVCISEVCVSTSAPRDGGYAKYDGGTYPKYDAGPQQAGWQAPERLGHPSTAGAITDGPPSVAVSDPGEVYLAFADSNGQVWARRHLAGDATWEPMVLVGEGALVGAAPLIAAASDGVVVAWSTGASIRARFFSNAGAWQEGWKELGEMNPSGVYWQSVELHALHMTNSGAALLFTYTQEPGYTRRAAVAASQFDPTWKTFTLGASSLGGGAPAMGVFDLGSMLAIHAVYVDGPAVKAVTLHYQLGSLYDDPVRTISPVGGTTYATPAFATDGAQRGLAVFGSQSQAELQAARLVDGSWSSPTRADSGLGSVLGPAAVGVDGSGNAAVLYGACTPGCSVWLTGYVSDGNLLPPVAVSAMGTVAEPHVALDGAGRLLGLWLQGEPGSASVVSSQLALPYTYSPPTVLNSQAGHGSASSPALGYRYGLGYAAWVLTEGSDRTIEGALYVSSVGK